MIVGSGSSCAISRRSRARREPGLVRTCRRAARVHPVGNQPADRDARADRRREARRASGRARVRSRSPRRGSCCCVTPSRSSPGCRPPRPICRRCERARRARSASAPSSRSAPACCPRSCAATGPSGPPSSVVLEELVDEDIVGALERGELDVGFVLLPVGDAPLETIELLRDPYVLVVPAGSPHATGPAPTLRGDRPRAAGRLSLRPGDRAGRGGDPRRRPRAALRLPLERQRDRAGPRRCGRRERDHAAAHRRRRGPARRRARARRRRAAAP